MTALGITLPKAERLPWVDCGPTDLADRPGSNLNRAFGSAAPGPLVWLTSVASDLIGTDYAAVNIR
jgi:hypothetical protein